jgi:hypothetical protein
MTWCNFITKSYTPPHTWHYLKTTFKLTGTKNLPKSANKNEFVVKRGDETVLCTPRSRLGIRAHEFQTLNMETPGSDPKKPFRIRNGMSISLVR